MRDGVRLFTVLYTPKDESRRYPFLMQRTPYGVGTREAEAKRYGVDRYPGPGATLGPSERFDAAGYLYVFQDVRGRYMSEGQWIEMTPTRVKRSKTDVDESSDMHDTVEWLLKHIPNHNGRVGIWGISYPGFYAAASLIDSHPAIKAASPQAPVADLYRGDDTYHGGAFMLAANFGFYSGFTRQNNPTDQPREWPRYDYGHADGYDALLKLGTLQRIAGSLSTEQQALFRDQWQHETYDDYWKLRSLPQYLRQVRCAVLTVGGWFDAEDPQGQFSVYEALERNNPGIFNALVIGPWVHGGATRTPGRRIGSVDFASDTGAYYRDQIALPFFEHHLKGAADPKLAEATVFETGTNVWRRYPAWPPPQAKPRTLYLQPQGGLGWQRPAVTGHDRYLSDPAKPVPFIGYPATGVPQEYMVSDQRFAALRPDVLVYVTPPLEEDLTITGPITPSLFVATSGSDADWVVKLIDVYPEDLPNPVAADDDGNALVDVAPPLRPLGGYQQLVRGEPFRGRYRRGLENPQPFVPGQVEPVRFAMPDIQHSFRRGHRIMVQLQSSWFPLVDRNPQQFIRIPDAQPEDFKAATQQVFYGGAQASGLELLVLPGIGPALGE